MSLTYTENYSLTDDFKSARQEASKITGALAFIRDCIGAGAL